MKIKNKLLTSIICLFMLAFCIAALSSCDIGKKCSHEWDDWSVTKKATCMEAKTEEHRCEKCGATESRTSGDAVDHKDDNTDHVCDYKCGKDDIGTHKDSTKDSDHDCDYCGESMGECTYPENSSICEVCGIDKNAPSPKPSNTSKPSIGEKANISYLDLFNSARNANKLAIKVQNFSYVINDDYEVFGSITQNGDIELELTIKDEKIEGAATGSVVIFNGPMHDENADCKFDAIIDGENLYIDLELADQTAGIKMDFDSILNESYVMTDGSAELIEFINDTLIPTVDILIELNSKEANDFLGDVYNMFYTFEKQSNGSYIATLDYNKIKTLNELLATPPVSEVIDMYFGKDTVKDLVALSKQILGLEPSEIPAYLDANRLDSDKIIDAINKLAISMDYSEDFDIEDMINDKALKGYTLGMLMFETEDDSYLEEIDNFVNLINEKSFYELYYLDDAGECKDIINKQIDAYAETLSITFVINRSGEFVSSNYKVNNYTYNDGYSDITVSFDMEIINNGEIDVTWSNIVKDIDNNIVLPEEGMLREDIYAYAYDGESGIVTYGGEDYVYTDGIYVRAYKKLYDKINYIMFMPEADDWTTYMAGCAQQTYFFTLATIYVDGNEVALIINEYSGEVVEVVQTPSGFEAIFENGKHKSFDFDFEDYEEYDDAYAAIFFEVFDDPEGMTYATGAEFTYRYNSKLNEYEFLY